MSQDIFSIVDSLRRMIERKDIKVKEGVEVYANLGEELFYRWVVV